MVGLAAQPYIQPTTLPMEPDVTPDERTLLQHFLSDLAQTQNVAKDPEADALINEAVRANPNALYLLVQHAILADQALHAAQAQLQAQPAPAFLPQGQPQTYQPQAYQPQTYQPQSYEAQGYPPQAYPGAQTAPWAGLGGQPVQSSPFAANSGLGGFLKQAGTMAAGVAAGDFLFQGIENIFSPR